MIDCRRRRTHCDSCALIRPPSDPSSALRARAEAPRVPQEATSETGRRRIKWRSRRRPRRTRVRGHQSSVFSEFSRQVFALSYRSCCFSAAQAEMSASHVTLGGHSRTIREFRAPSRRSEENLNRPGGEFRRAEREVNQIQRRARANSSRSESIQI